MIISLSEQTELITVLGNRKPDVIKGILSYDYGAGARVNNEYKKKAEDNLEVFFFLIIQCRWFSDYLIYGSKKDRICAMFSL